MKEKIAFLSFILVIIFTSGVVLADTTTIRPSSQGNYAQWTNTNCGSGSSEWECVDEDPADTFDNLYTGLKNNHETFAFQDTGLTTESINSVTIYYYGQRVNSNRYKFQPLVRASSTDYLGSVISLTASYAYYNKTYTTNPDTGNQWTISEVNSLEAGMKSYSDNYGGRIAQVYAVVDYTNQSEPDSCSDTDGGNILTILGIASGYNNNTFYSNQDFCVDSGTILEYYCSGTNQVNQSQSCGTDSYVGSNYCSSGDVFRNYTDYSCGSGACSSNITSILQQDCTSSCSNGQCVQDNSCSDSDGGEFIEIFGNVTGFFNQNSYGFGDFCVDSEVITEYRCEGAFSFSRNISCITNSTTSCSSGMCI